MLYADLTIFFVNVVQIVSHFHIKYREKVYIFGGLIQHNEKSCTNNLNSKSFVHLFKGGGFPKGGALWSPVRNGKQSLPAKSPLFQKNGARGEKCESISRGGVLKLASTDRTPLVTVWTYFPSKTFRWNVLDKAIPHTLYKV